MTDIGVTIVGPPDEFTVQADEQASLVAGVIHRLAQVALDGNGDCVGGDDAGAQAVQVYRNIRSIFAYLGPGPQNMVEVRVYLHFAGGG